MAIDRVTFIATKLALLDEVQQKSLKSNQMGSVIGSIRLQAELAQILGYPPVNQMETTTCIERNNDCALG